MYPEANVRGGSNRTANTSREMAQKGRDTDGERMRDPQGSGSGPGPGLPAPPQLPGRGNLGWDGMGWANPAPWPDVADMLQPKDLAFSLH